MEYDLSKIQVHPDDLKLLKKLRRKKSLLPGNLDVQNLFLDELIQPARRCQDTGVNEIELSDKGKFFLQWRSEDMFRHRWPVYLSIAALAISIAAFIRSFWP